MMKLMLLNVFIKFHDNNAELIFLHGNISINNMTGERLLLLALFTVYIRSIFPAQYEHYALLPIYPEYPAKK